MNKYLFITKEFGITETGIHLLRSRFNFETIPFSEIETATIEKGKELNNWFIILLIGITLIIPGIIVSYIIVSIISTGDITAYQSRMAMILFIPFVGLYFIYKSLSNGLILKIERRSNKIKKFPLREIIKQKMIRKFISFLRTKLQSKLELK